MLSIGGLFQEDIQGQVLLFDIILSPPQSWDWAEGKQYDVTLQDLTLIVCKT